MGLRFSSAALLVLAGFDPVNSQGAEPIRSTGIMRNGSDVAVSFEAQQGSWYRLERKLDLTDPFWQGISGVNDLTADGNGPAQIVDPDALNLGKAFYRVDLIGCDAGIPSNATDPLQYAAAMGLCQTTTEEGAAPGVISAALTLASGAGNPRHCFSIDKNLIRTQQPAPRRRIDGCALHRCGGGARAG